MGPDKGSVDQGFRVREASVQDLPIVLRHRELMFRDMGFLDPEDLARSRALAETFFASGLSDHTYRGWLVEDARGNVVAGGGIVLLSHHASPRDPFARRPVAVNVYTEPAHRHRGLARRLMEVMIQWSREEGFHSLYLHASQDGRHLYETLGFEPTNEMRLDLTPGPGR
jgi:GNAT superfamily N-acetyltransferase